MTVLIAHLLVRWLAEAMLAAGARSAHREGGCPEATIPL